MPASNRFTSGKDLVGIGNADLSKAMATEDEKPGGLSPGATGLSSLPATPPRSHEHQTLRQLMAGAATPPEVIPHSHPDESAAHAMAEAVMRMPGPGRQPTTNRPDIPGGLDPDTRAFFEYRFGADLRDVRVHSDPAAAHSAARLGASAYTVGTDIVMGDGQQAGPNLVTAHELAHVVRGDAVGRLCRAPAETGGFAIISGVWRVADRDIVLVATGHGNQVLYFYRRTGLGDKGVGIAPKAEQWVPFKTLMEHPDPKQAGKPWFNKNPYYTTVGPDDPLRGYGNTRNRDVGAWLDKQEIPAGVEAESWERAEQEMDQVAARYRASTPSGGPGEGSGPAGTTEVPAIGEGGGEGMAIPEGTLAGEEIGIAEGVLAGELLAEGAAMLEYGFWFLGLPLLLDWMSGGLAADEAARRREEINEAWKAATPEIQSALRRLGVGDDPSGDYAGILQQTKEGKTIYANIEFQLVAPSTAWHGYAMLTPEEAGQPRNRDDAELTDSPSASLAAESEYWATESKRFRIRLIDVRLSTSNIHQDEGGGTYVMSLAVYSPKALATELLSNVPETA